MCVTDGPFSTLGKVPDRTRTECGEAIPRRTTSLLLTEPLNQLAKHAYQPLPASISNVRTLAGNGVVFIGFPCMTRRPGRALELDPGPS